MSYQLGHVIDGPKSPNSRLQLGLKTENVVFKSEKFFNNIFRVGDSKTLFDLHI